MLKTVTDGRAGPPRGLVRRGYELWDWTRRWLAREVQIRDGANVYRFRCDSLLEVSRSMGLFTKEPGTCRWITEAVREGDVFYDIGANIGVYTVLAGRRVGRTGKVFAFEPHSANFARLLDNIAANDLQDVVVPCNFALNDQEGLFEFHYASPETGTANSQLGTLYGAHEQTLRPAITEMKFAISIDRLVATHGFVPPDHVKLDVDGNEPLILRGMCELLGSDRRPRSIQVEMNKRGKEDAVLFLRTYGYEVAEKHHTRSGLKRMRRGLDPEDYSYNAVFRAA